MIPLLVAVALLSVFGLAGITYFGARANAIAAAQTRTLQDAQVMRQLIADQGANVTTNNDQLVVGVDNAMYPLNGDTMLVDRTRSLVGGYATIYQLVGDRLTAVATNLPAGKAGSRALGDALTGAAYDALVGNCGAVDSSSCHQTFAGVVTLHGQEYVAGFQPLYDGSGGFVGALGIALPMGEVLGPVNQLTVVVLLVGLLISFLSIAMGTWLVGRRTDRMLATLDIRLDAVAASAAELERLARMQVERANQQNRVSRQMSEQTRALDALAAVMDQGQHELRDSAGGIWHEMSQPGAAPDPQKALEWARQAAVVSARVGTAAEQAHEVCCQLITLVNHVMAESDSAREGGQEMQASAQALRKAVEGVEVAVGDRLIQRPHGFDALALPRRARGARTADETAAQQAAPARQRRGRTPAGNRADGIAQANRPQTTDGVSSAGGTSHLPALWPERSSATAEQPHIARSRGDRTGIHRSLPRTRPANEPRDHASQQDSGSGEWPDRLTGQTSRAPFNRPGQSPSGQRQSRPLPPHGFSLPGLTPDPSTDGGRSASWEHRRFEDGR